MFMFLKRYSLERDTQMSDDYFNFTKYHSVVIYGGNKNGMNYYRQLTSEGYLIQCFIDKRASEYNGILNIDEKKVPIYDPEEINKLDLEVIIFVAVRNAVEQNNVAKMLWTKGFQNIIYLPMIKENMQNVKSINCLRKFYQEFVDGRIQENAILPKQKLLLEGELFWDHAIIRQDDKYVTAWIPVSMIHYYAKSQSDKMIQQAGITTSKGLGEKYLDRSIFQLEWLNDLFRFLIRGQGSLEDYWRIEEKISNHVKQQSTKENQLWFSDRQKCAEILMSGMNTGSDFLIGSAFPVQWNEKGYFNICDGGHRLAFLNCIYMNMAVVQMKHEDYKKWINREVLEEFLDFIQKNKITAFEAPIPHPWFYGCETKEEKFGNTILKCVLEQLMQFQIYDNFSVLDVNPKEGYYLQHFARIDAKDVTGIVYDEKQLDFLVHLNRLCYMEEFINLVTLDDEQENHKKYDIVLMLKKLSEFSEKEQIKYIKWIAFKATKMIIWESGVDYEKEKKLIMQYSGFKDYIFLKWVLSENVIRETGIFLK